MVINGDYDNNKNQPQKNFPFFPFLFTLPKSASHQTPEPYQHANNETLHIQYVHTIPYHQSQVRCAY